MPEKLIEISWLDHAFHQGEYDADFHGLVEQRSIGFLVYEDALVIKIAQTMTRYSEQLIKPQEILVVDKKMLTGKKTLRRS